MSSSLWAECDGSRSIGRLTARASRAVEAQHVISTRKLVDSDDEQRVLEELLDRSKPRLPRLPELSRLHYLLSTSFRYPPLPHGSRFGTRSELGIWYGSEALSTLFAEIAYYRLVFLEGTTGQLPRLIVELSAFQVPIRSSRAVDLTRGTFAAHARRVSSKQSYAASQRLGRDMRGAGVETFRYTSARDPGRGSNIGVFEPRAFGARRPHSLETWICVATPNEVEVQRKDFFRRQSFRFERSAFEVRGRLPTPAC
jgi:hypothetical protein